MGYNVTFRHRCSMCNNQIRIIAYIKQEIYSISDANTQKSASLVREDGRLETLWVRPRVGVEKMRWPLCFNSLERVDFAFTFSVNTLGC